MIDAEFEIYCDDGFVASVSGPRESAWREAMHYVSQYMADGEIRVMEVKRWNVSFPMDDEEGAPQPIETSTEPAIGKAE